MLFNIIAVTDFINAISSDSVKFPGSKYIINIILCQLYGPETGHHCGEEYSEKHCPVIFQILLQLSTLTVKISVILINHLHHL